MKKTKEKETLGQRICAAVVSHQMGISFERAMKLYVRGREIHASWEAAGKQLLGATGRPEIPGSGSKEPIARESREIH